MVNLGLQVRFVLLVHLFFPIISEAQEFGENQDPSIYTDAFSEKIILFTDRSVYAVGEEILVSAHCWNTIQSNSLSSIIYMEIIAPDGTSFIQMKYPVLNNKANDKITIPVHWHTGNYLIKAYTKWMRNFHQKSYAYQAITIINPSNPHIQQKQNNGGDMVVYKQVETMKNFSLQTDLTSYSTREKVNVSFIGDSSMTGYCVSVVKQGAKNLSEIRLEMEGDESNTKDLAVYYPEIKGITLSGKVWNENHRLPVSDAALSMAILSDVSFFFTSTTNKNGAFFIVLPGMEKANDIFINAVKEDLNLSIEIDKDFCSKPVNLNIGAFNLSEYKADVVTEICINAQINKAFTTPIDAIKKEEENKTTLSFYGTPDKTFYTDRYIEMQTIQDFMFEIIPEVKVEKKQLVPSFKTGRNNSLSSLPYLVLIDNIPINNNLAFLAIETNKIDRIELNNCGYIVGNKQYCGIINAFSKNNDMAGIDLPKNSMFFKYSLLNDYLENTKKVESHETEDTHLPDRRNCLYWNPYEEFVAGEINNFSFYTNDVPGPYQIIVQAISKNEGNPLVYVSTFLVE